MFIHMFIFRWKPGVTDEQKSRVVPAILALQGKIPGLIETLAGTNQSSKSPEYKLAGVMKFADKAAMDAYGDHPAHVELLEWLMPLIDAVEADFEP
jgi:hypothetical protein